MQGSVVLVGAFHETIELCESAGIRIVGIFDPVRAGEYRGYPVLGPDAAAVSLANELRQHPLLLTPDEPAARRRLAKFYEECGYTFRSVVAPSAIVSPSARIGAGTLVQAGVHVSADVVVGNHAHLNTCCNVMHDAVVGNFVTVAPNAVLLGYVRVQTAAYLGSNATILPRRTVGEAAVVGAGAVVTRDVRGGTTVVGCPARELSKG